MADPLRITVYKNPDWVEDTPEVLRNPDATAADVAAYRLARGVKRNPLPVEDDRFKALGPANPDKPSYIVEPDLMETQGGMKFPEGLMQRDDGSFYYVDTPNQNVPMVRRPNVLPITATPEGYKLVMPKMLDIVGNVGSPLVAGKVPVKAGEMVLGSGAVRTMPETVPTFYSTLERAVSNAKVEKAGAEQWLGYLRNQPGVKAEELETVLRDMPQGMITKGQLQELVQNNKVQLQEKVLGTQNPEAIAAKKAFDDYGQELGAKYDLNPLQNLAMYGKMKGIKKEEIDKYLELQKRYHDLNEVPKTKYHSYQLPGGENYRELLVNLPVKTSPKAQEAFDLTRRMNEGEFNSLNDVQRKELFAKRDRLLREAKVEEGEAFKAPHFDEHGRNLLYHVRMNDRNIEGNKTLHLEEIQSDLHQKGRKEGYKLSEGERTRLDKNAEAVDEKLIAANRDDIMGNPDLKAGLAQAVKDKVITQKEADDYLKLTTNERSTVPDAPFKKNWDELALKRMIRKASEEGYEAISWTPGKAQAERYDLSKQVKGIHWQPSPADKSSTLVQINPTSGDALKLQVDGNGKITTGFPSSRTHQWEGKSLADVVGKEHADKILGKKDGSLEGEGLKIGGEGMQAFYDKMLVDRANALGKKYGVKVEQKEITNKSELALTAKQAMDKAKDHYGAAWANMSDAEKFEAQAKFQKSGEIKQPVHYLKLTPELKAKAMNEGFPLFSSVPITVPVDYVPEFKEKYKLTPVDYNPFGD